MWNVPAIPAGQYYIGAVLNDGTHPAVVAYADGVLGISGPAVQVYNPTTDLQWHSGGSVAIRYEVTSTHPGTVGIFYDKDGVPDSGDETFLLTQAVQSGPVTWTWNGGVLKKGTYHIGVKVTDNVVNNSVTTYATGLIVENGPLLAFTSPAAPLTLHTGDVVNIAWQDQADAVNADITLFYDTDKNYGNGGYVTIATGIKEDDPADTYAWTVPSTLKPGTYYIGGTISDGVNPPLVVYADSAAITVPVPTIVFSNPTSNIVTVPGNTFTISWTHGFGAIPANVNLFYEDRSVSPAVKTSMPGYPKNGVTLTAAGNDRLQLDGSAAAHRAVLHRPDDHRSGHRRRVGDGVCAGGRGGPGAGTGPDGSPRGDADEGSPLGRCSGHHLVQQGADDHDAQAGVRQSERAVLLEHDADRSGRRAST